MAFPLACNLGLTNQRRTRRGRRPLELEALEERALPSGFADTSDGIHIFMDQLGNLSPKMTQFLATHIDGTEKQTPGQIANLRAVNPNFTLINYRLGTMAGPPQYIINGQWNSDWAMVTTHEDWFAHQTYSGEPQSAADLASGRIRDTPDNSYQMDISNVSWQNYWLTSELQNLQATGADGVFVDSFTYGIGGAGHDSPPLRYQGTNAANSAYWPGGVSWTTQLGNWARTIETTFQQYNAAHGTDYKFLPNLDARATTWEPNWYYAADGKPFIDGAFLEGFGGYTDTYNWRLSMNRGLDLTRNDKIVIMQPYTSSSNQQQLDFLMGTYLLLKSNHTYLAINGTDYYPEYQVNIGTPTTPIPTAAQGVDGYLWNGVYRRDFTNGFVLVNPGSTTYNLNLGGTYQFVQGHGGGPLSDAQIDAAGNYIGGSLTYQNMSGITLVGGSAAIFLNAPSSNAAPTVATAARATPGVVSGLSTALSVLGADDKGEGNLTYTWSVSGPAGVTFSANASNAAKNATATFSRAGTYTFTVTITDQGGLSTTGSANASVNQTLTRLTVSPGSATVPGGTTQQFAATAFDQFNQALATQPAFTWTLASGVGSVSATGLYTVPTNGGGAVVQATAGGVSGSASVTVQAAVIAPSITSQPTSQTVTAGQAVTLTVAASGTGPLTYQWQKSVNGTWSNVGTNAATFSIGAAAAADAGTYRVVVTNSAGSATSNVVSLTVNGIVVGTGTGLTGQYFRDQTLTNLALTRIDATVNFDWGSGSPDPSVPMDHFSARWTGQVQAQVTATYTFFTQSDDGVRLWVNGQLLIDNWTDHAPAENSATIALTAGQKYDIKMEYYENGGGAVAQLLWSSPATAKQAIPTSQLYAVPVTVTPPGITTQPTSLTVTAGQSATFTVAASGTAPLTYQWQKSVNGTWSNVGTNAATYAISATTAADAGSYRVVVTNAAGSVTSNAVTLTVNSVATLPAPWVDADVGGPGQRGSASAANGTFTVQGGGADIWNGADQFHYAYQTLTGDGTIVARVVSQQNTDPWAKAGVMVRASTAANSTYAFAFVTPGNGADFQYRTTTGGAAGWSGQVSATAPEWVKLVRTGSTLTGYASADGVTWTRLGAVTIGMGSTVTVGLAVTAHNNAALSTATFTNVSVTAAPAGAPIVLRISQDFYLGDAQYTVTVDGQQIGGVRTATALRSQGKTEAVTLAGPFAGGRHTVTVSFINDAWGGTAATDRNLYVDGLDFLGQSYAGGTLFSNGTLTFTLGS